MTAVFVLLLFSIAAPLLARYVGWRFIPLIGIFASLALLPGRLLFGIPLSLIFIVACAVLGLLESQLRSIPALFIPLIVYLVVMQLLEWHGDAASWSRTWELFFSAAAWTAGVFAARLFDARDARGARGLALLILMIVIVQAIVAALQTAGFQIFVSTGPNAELTEGRASGTLSHPGNLGKMVLFLVMLALPLTRRTDRLTRNFAFAAVLGSFVSIGLSESRANFIALVAMSLLWAVLLPRGSSRWAKIALPIGVIGIGLVFLEPILERFESDPEGGFRNHLMDVALAHIGENLWGGVGPQNFIPYFGQYDAVVASGWPVHNAFVLQAAELGLAGALLLFLPLFAFPLIQAFRFRKSEGQRGDVARSLLSAVPAIAIVGTTGWSLTSGDIALMLFFVVALMTRLIVVSEPELLPAQVQRPAVRRGAFA